MNILLFIKRASFVSLTLWILSCSHNSPSDPALISGLDSRPSNQTCIAPEQGPLSSPEIILEPAFPVLPALGPVVAIRQAPGDTSQWYAALQDGRVMVFDNDVGVTTSTEYLNIQSQIVYGGEQGLLGMAFHPDYVNNGEIFLYYSTNVPNLRSNISRFTFVNNVWQEEIILSVKQPYENHNGGNILFGPDGYLYIGLGDGGGAGDPNRNGQNQSTLLGSMLRIDIDSGSPYTIPSDNPNAGNPLCNNPDTVVNSEFCPEIYAYGLRNPWRWSFDRMTNALWLGDVGQNRIEEIDIVQNGQNYGWRVMEGSECYNSTDTNCNATGEFVPPVAEYSHNGGGASVVGGYVYRGNDPELAFLYGSYLFADTYSGQIWKTTFDGTNYTTTPLLDSSLLIYSFSESQDGDIYVLSPNDSGTGNNIYKFSTLSNPSPASTIPEYLSSTGCFSSTVPLSPATGVIAYDINSPLWSDGAEKQRFFAIPDNSRINVTDEGDFIFPAGSVLIKHFILNDKPIETRMLMRHADYWGGYSYEWQYDTNGNPVDAQLLDTGKSVIIDGQNWLYPSRSQCFECHTTVANISLGLETLQLNRDLTYAQTGRAANQLDTLQAVGIFSSQLSIQLRRNKLYELDDASTSFENRAKSYLHANCAFCHQPTGSTPVAMDFRYTTPLPAMNICDVAPQESDLGITGLKLFDPNGSFLQPNSAIVMRMESVDANVRMPPLATEIVHDDAVNILKSWVEETISCN